MVRSRGTAILSAALLLGCVAETRPLGPQETLHEYARRVRSGDAQGAYALLSSGARQRIPFDHFRKMLLESQGDVDELASVLERQGQAVSVTATVVAPNGETLELVYEDGVWKADLSAIDLYSQATPMRALEAFVRAFENRRYDVLMRFVPEGDREGLDEAVLRDAWEGEQREEIERLVQALKAALPTASVEVLGNRATVAYGAGGNVQLLEESGAWKIEEF